MNTLLAVASLVALCAMQIPAMARLGENEAASQARYGVPVEGMVGGNEEPLAVGAKEVVYKFEGWRVRAAFLNGLTTRIQYAQIPDAGGLRKLTEADVQTVLEAEKDRYRWREEKPRTGYKELNALKTAFDGRHWERSDHARAHFAAELVLTLETQEMAAYRKKAEKQQGKATPVPGVVPKF